MSSIESKFLDKVQEDERYHGKWVAVLKDKVVASGTELEVVYETAMKNFNGEIPPLIEYISMPSDEEVILIL